MRRIVLVDGYNVIRRDPALARLEKTSLELARNTLLACLNGSRQFRHDDVTVVFDGGASREAGVTGSRTFRRGRVQVIFSLPGESADDVLQRLGATAPAGTLVVTDDRAIRDSVAAAGVQSTNLAPRVPPRPGPPPPRPTGTWVKEDDLAPPPPASKKGNGHRAPRKRNRPPGDLHW